MNETVKISEFLKTSQIIQNILSTNKDDVIRELARPLLENKEIQDKEHFLNEIFEREEKGSTGIGGGIAIPHCRTDDVSEILVSIGLSKEGIDFDSIDDEKVKVFFLLAIPKTKMQIYIMIISKLTKILNTKGVLGQLLETQSKEEIIKIFQEAEDKI